MRLWLSVAPILMSSCLSFGKYAEKLAEKDCSEGLECAESYECDYDPAEELPDEADCDFDRAAARQCLDAEWTCNTTFPGFEYAVPPTACEAVCTPLETSIPSETI